jgi:outer membrane protein OmpA-like peptidoglycan-associated protein
MKILNLVKKINTKTASLAVVLLLSVFNPAFSTGNFQELAWAAPLKSEGSTRDIQLSEIQTGNYLVVGTFSYLSNAKKYTNLLRSGANYAQLAYCPSNSHYYVYLLNSSDINKVRKERDKVRKEGRFHDAWVLSLDANKNLKAEGKQKFGNNLKSESTNERTEGGKLDADEETPIVFSNNKSGKKSAMKELKIYVNSYDANTYKELASNVKVIYGEQDKLAGTMQSHALRTIEVPVDEISEIQLECQVFGYRKNIHDLNINKPLTEESKEFMQVSGDSLIVNFELIPYKKGDIFIMYNVFFHNDAAIMQPRSAYEANSLLAMMKQNDKLKIKLHGHTNGNAFGKLIKMSDKDADFFNLRPTNESGVGSAKKLSYERALTIKKYLVAEGVDESRIEVEGWGGKKMIYQNDANEAKKNARVEVEILQDK